MSIDTGEWEPSAPVRPSAAVTRAVQTATDKLLEAIAAEALTEAAGGSLVELQQQGARRRRRGAPGGSRRHSDLR